jgi:transcriptional regulator with XRE-family HTH domain
MLLRETVGEVLRRHRLEQDRTLREVSAAAAVSLGYLSEIERGKKEPSSELLAAVCAALRVPLPLLLREVSDELATAAGSAPVPVPAVVPIAAARSCGGVTVDCVAA